MNKQRLEKMIGALKTITEVLEDTLKSLPITEVEGATNKGKKEDKKSVVPNESKQLKSKKVEKRDVEVEEEDVDIDLTTMNYNDLKAQCKELGLSAKGTKDTLIERIQEHLGVNGEEEEDLEDVEQNEENEDEVDVEEILNLFEIKELKEMAKEFKVKLPVKATKAKAIEKLQGLDNLVELLVEKGYLEDEEDEEDMEDDVEETEEEEENPYEEIEQMSDEDLKELLKSAGKSTKGKHQALVAKVIKAIEDGEIDLEEDEDDEEEVEVEYVGSKERLKAIENLDQDMRESYEAEEITDKEIKKFLDKIHNGKFDTSDLEDNLEEYIRINCELIDDEGEQNDLEQAYYIGDDVYCCGHKTKEVEGDMYCEHCGTSWEV